MYKVEEKTEKVNQNRHPNFRDGDSFSLYLVRCFRCDAENYTPSVASGQCYFCGWSEVSEV